jgi:hypothetical protein
MVTCLLTPVQVLLNILNTSTDERGVPYASSLESTLCNFLFPPFCFLLFAFSFFFLHLSGLLFFPPEKRASEDAAFYMKHETHESAWQAAAGELLLLAASNAVKCPSHLLM